MEVIEQLFQEFVEGIEELEYFANLLRHDNTRWRGQQREGGCIDLESIEGDAWLTYFRFVKEI